MHVRPNKSQNPAKSQNSSLSSAASTSNQFQSRPFEAQGETNTHLLTPRNLLSRTKQEMLSRLNPLVLA